MAALAVHQVCTGSVQAAQALQLHTTEDSSLKLTYYRIAARVLDFLRVRHRFRRRLGGMRGAVTRKNRVVDRKAVCPPSAGVIDNEVAS